MNQSKKKHILFHRFLRYKPACRWWRGTSSPGTCAAGRCQTGWPANWSASPTAHWQPLSNSWAVSVSILRFRIRVMFLCNVHHFRQRNAHFYTQKLNNNKLKRDTEGKKGHPVVCIKCTRKVSRWSIQVVNKAFVFTCIPEILEMYRQQSDPNMSTLAFWVQSHP